MPRPLMFPPVLRPFLSEMERNGAVKLKPTWENKPNNGGSIGVPSSWIMMNHDEPQCPLIRINTNDLGSALASLSVEARSYFITLIIIGHHQ